MNKKKGIVVFAILFCLALLTPFFLNISVASTGPEVSVDTAVINALDEKNCVASTEYMKSSHMQMLDEWRNDVVRKGSTEYTSNTGQIYEKSLDNTCLGCHTNREEFCDKCHEYSGVELYCWECHGGSGS
ncbi:MAG: sulfate reduction electron transfer complex DsrMKJOP subunit DsrJ [Raoultibacter sp.]